MPSAADGLSLRLERSMAGLSRLGGWVDEIAATLRLPPAQEYALRLCLEEAVANAVMHGDPAPGGRDDVVLRVRRLATSDLRVTIEDRCAAFDPLRQPEPDRQAGLEERPVGGMGIHLMRQFTRTMTYRRTDGVNRLDLTIAGQ